MTWRPSSFRLGSMRERINVLTALVDESSGQPIRTWKMVHEGEPAAWMPTAGTETVRGRQVEAGIAAVFIVHYRAGYNVEQKIEHNGQSYGIVYVKQAEGGRRYIELHCKAVPNG